MSETVLLLVIVVLFISLLFALTNGLNDAGSVVATFIACGGASPAQAVIWASIFGLLGALFGGSAVSNAVAKVVNIPIGVDILPVLIAGMVGAIVWNLFSWQMGIPSSSTHALVGGLIGAVWVSFGPGYVLWGFTDLFSSGHHLTGITAIVIALIFSPILGFAMAYIIQNIINMLLRNAKYSINRWLKYLQWAMSALLAYGHGANDAQKVMGIITLALLSVGVAHDMTTPQWVRWAGGMTMFAGTVFGGWPIMKTLGRGIFTLRPVHSLTSQVASGASIMLATALGAPVSTTHVVASTVIGLGASENYKMVNWSVGRSMLIAWCVTIPSAAVAAAIVYYPVIWLFYR